MKSINNKTFFFLIFTFVSTTAFSQEIVTKSAAPPNATHHSNQIDSLRPDSLAVKPKNVKISKDAITNDIKYGAVDSNFTDVTNKVVHLYGSAQVDYEKIKLRADYIKFNFSKNIISAYYTRDSSYVPKGKSTFEDGDTKLGFKEINYNFKTKKAIIRQFDTHQSEFFVLGEKAKFVGKENDTLSLEDKFYQEDAIITTCNHNPPHFGIRTRKMKLIPQKIAVMGPAQLHLSGIPTPLVLPFGFFPLVKGASSGLIFPRDYTYDQAYGFGLQGIGYYFPINDKLDLTVLLNIWTRGTHRVEVSSNYMKRYKYRGNIDINYSNNINEDQFGKRVSEKSFGIRLTHNQDQKAHPYRQLGGSIDIQTNKNQLRNNYDYQSQVNNKLYSNLNFSYKWPESPFSFRAALSHNQDNKTGIINITLPEASVNMNTINPFKRKNATGDQRWFENISVDYKAGLKNFVKTTDTTLFTRATLDNLETGFKHGTNLSTNARFLKYFNVNPSMAYEETYFLKTLELEFDTSKVFQTFQKYDVNGQPIKDANGEPVVETRVTKYGSVNRMLKNEFRAFRRFNMGFSVNTQMFATKRFKKGFIRGIRHIVKPSIGFNYAPATDIRYGKYVDTDSRPEFNKQEFYNPFQTGAFAQSLNEKQMAITYSFNNVFEAKFRGKKDTVDKKVNLFNNIYVNGNYNFAKDSFKWSDVSISGNTSILRGLTNLNISALLTPYEVDFKNRKRLKTLAIKSTTNKKLVQFLSMDANFSTSLSFKQITGIFKGKSTEETKEAQLQENRNKKKTNEVSFSSLFDNINISHTLAFAIDKGSQGQDSFYVSAHNINVSGSIPLSKNWNFNFGSVPYDFIGKKLRYPSFGFSRDLHCWTMRFSWYPESGVYSFFIGVKSGALNFLKYDYNQPYIPR